MVNYFSITPKSDEWALIGAWAAIRMNTVPCPVAYAGFHATGVLRVLNDEIR